MTKAKGMWLARLLLVLMLFSATSCAREVAEVTNERASSQGELRS